MIIGSENKVLLQQIFNGIIIGNIYALVTIGFNLVFGILGLTNFAHSSFFMLAAYIGQFIIVRLIVEINPFLALIFTFVFTTIISGVLGAIMDVSVLRPVRRSESGLISMIIATVGVQTIINNSILLIFGNVPLSFPNLLDFDKNIVLDSLVIQPVHVFIVLITAIIFIFLIYLIYRTDIGKSMRAIAQDSVAARLVGVNVNKTVTITFFIGTSLAAIAGLTSGMYYQKVDTFMGNSIGVKAFSSAVLGGMGSMKGAVVGGFIIGISETLFAAYVSSGYRDIVSFVILILSLMIRPDGIFGKIKSDRV